MATLRQTQALATRERLLDVAADLFASRGFGEVTTTSLCEAAGVTRGALYHHFANLGSVMEAVFARAEGALVADVSRALARLSDPRERLGELGPITLEFLARQPHISRIVFVEAPAALGWTRWRALDGGRSVEAVRALLAELSALGHLVDGVDPHTAAPVIIGAINEAGMVAVGAPGGAATTAHQTRLLCRGLLRDEAPAAQH